MSHTSHLRYPADKPRRASEPNIEAVATDRTDVNFDRTG